MSKTFRLVIAVFTLFLSTSIHAQLNVSLGLKGGANYFTVIGPDAGGESGLIGAYGGPLIRFTEADNEWLKYVVQAELNYSMQGYQYEKDKLSLSYVTLPILIQRYFGYSSFYLETGPQFGFLVTAKQKINSVMVDVKDSSKPFDFSLNAGLGYLTNSGLGINARLNYGLLSNSKDYDVRNAGLSFGLFYVFGYGVQRD